MGDESKLPIGIVVAFGFLMVMIALAGINLRLQAQRRQAKEQERESQVRAQSDEKERLKAVQEAIRRDPSLSQKDDPEVLKRLTEAVVEIQQEWAVRDDLQKVEQQQRTEAEYQKQQEERAQIAEEQRREQAERARIAEEQRREREAAQIAREERLAEMSPVRRLLARNPKSLAGLSLALIAFAAIGVTAFWQVQQDRALTAAREEGRAESIANMKEQEEIAEVELQAAKEACDLETAEVTNDRTVLFAYRTCSDSRVRNAVASNPEVGFSTLQELAQDEDPEVRISTIEQLSARAGVEGNTAPLRLLEELTLDPDPSIRSAVARAVNTSPKILSTLMADESPLVRSEIARNPSSNEAVLDRIDYNDSVLVAEALAVNQNASTELLGQLTSHPDDGVIAKACETLSERVAAPDLPESCRNA